VLSDKEVRGAYSGDGLNELVWETLASPRFSMRTEIFHLMGRAYVEIHRGFRLKEMITSQAESPERLQRAMDAGGLFWDPEASRYRELARSRTKQLAKSPHGKEAPTPRLSPRSFRGTASDSASKNGGSITLAGDKSRSPYIHVPKRAKQKSVHAPFAVGAGTMPSDITLLTESRTSMEFGVWVETRIGAPT
jgi:hypothetical protein